MCLTRIQENQQNDFFHAVVSRACEYGYKVMVYNSFSDLYTGDRYDAGESRIFDLIPYDMLDGLIVMSETIKDETVLNKIISSAHEHGIYTVCVDKRIDGCFNVEFNYRSAFEAIVRHVIEKHGCRTINLVAGFKGNAFSEERIQCCRRIMAEKGLELDKNRILYGDFWADPTARAFDDFMLSGLSMPDAFICCNDSMAITVCAKLKDYGYKVPEDVIVTGFDGIMEERYHIPRLTTARQDVELAGEKAVDAIVSNVNGRETDNFCVIDHKVVWSHSCGCKPIDYREATGQITPLFKMSDADNNYDTYMSEFSAAASAANGIGEVAETVLKYNGFFGYYYYALSLNEDFMNISDAYEDFISDQREDKSSANRLILCESTGPQHYTPYFDTHLRHFGDALEEYNVFLHWSVHFQDKYIGYGVMGLSTGCDKLNPNDDIRHIVRYTRNLNNVLEIANSQSVLKKVIAKLQDLYIRDHTGLYNRRGFYTEIQRCISAALDAPGVDSYLIIISVDMDGLKFINDNYGHAEGDVAIKAIASALISVWGESEICSRFGGDEFTVASVCHEEPEKKGEELVKKIQAVLDSYNSSSGKPYKVSASFGVHYEKITPDLIVDNLIKYADDLMYRDKATHRESRCRSSVRK